MAVQKMTAQDIIRRLDMVPLGAEGGMVKETWRSKKKDHGISDGSAIYYLLTEDSFSHLHRLTGEEVYHFYMGDPVELCELKQDGSMQITVLGTSGRRRSLAGLPLKRRRKMGTARYNHVSGIFGRRI